MLVRETTMPKNRRWVLARRPQGEPSRDDFRLERVEISGDAPQGSVLVRNRHLSLDPYMRLRMNEGRSYVPPYQNGETIGGQTIGEVIASGDPGFAPGDIVTGSGGWQDYALLPARTVRRLPGEGELATIAMSAWLGVLGMPGFTGFVGLSLVGHPRAGETVVVAAATGPVGSMVGQLARRAGARAVAIAGGGEKCALALDHFGFDAAIDHRDPDFPQKLSQACPDGIDLYFENVGGPTLAAVLPLLNDFARIPVCGLIAHYNETTGDQGMPAAALMREVLVRRLSLRGFIVSDHLDEHARFMEEVAPQVASGAIKGLEDVIEGLEQAPEALAGLLRGDNRGKVVIAINGV
jgi:NADPH-dependent curcumin reductase CurA